MRKAYLVFVLIVGIFIQSCGFLFYNYRCSFDSNFTIPNQTSDTSLRYEIGKYILELSNKHSFYERFSTPTYDSLYLYGPDYHTLTFKIGEINQTTSIQFHYFGYNGSRSNPPQKAFIQTLTDSLKLKFGATETINIDFNNERKKKNGT